MTGKLVTDLGYKVIVGTCVSRTVASFRPVTYFKIYFTGVQISLSPPAPAFFFFLSEVVKQKMAMALSSFPLLGGLGSGEH